MQYYVILRKVVNFSNLHDCVTEGEETKSFFSTMPVEIYIIY